MENKWYVLKVTPGKERQMSDHFNTLISLGRMEYVTRFICPTEREVVTTKKKKTYRDRVLYNGYLYFEAQNKLNDEELKEISVFPSVMSMLGDKRPKLMGPVDIQKIIKDDKLDLHRENKLVAFMIGEEVTLTDGPFTSFVGTITDIKGDKVTLNVRIFGRFTSVTIDIEHIKKT